MGDSVEDAFSMVGIGSPRALIYGQDLIFGDGKHDTIGPMPHGFDTVSKVIVPIIGQMFFGQDLAFELKISNKGVSFHVLIIFEEDVVFDFHDNLYK